MSTVETHIYSKITNEIFEFTANTGKKPKHLYLGRKENFYFLEWVGESKMVPGVSLPEIKGTNRNRLMGILIYEVDSESHLACS